MQLLTNRTHYIDLLYAAKGQDNPISGLRELCKSDLFFLLVYGLNRHDADRDWIFDRCRDVQASPDGMLDLWSREHYKSTIITFALTIQEILKNPEITIGIFSHTRPLAKGFLRQIKQEFELNKTLCSWFPDILYEAPIRDALKWSEDDGIIVKRKTNPKESTLEAWGVVDGQPTGKHFQLLIYDDVVTKESVTSPEMILKTTDSLALSYNLGAQGGRRRFIGTRYHFNDTYKVIMDRRTVTTRLHPATEDGTADGEPVLLTMEQLQDKRRDMGSYVFSSQMLLNPVADSSQNFKREWLRHYSGEPPKGCVWYLLVDAANGKRKTNDYTSMWAVGLGLDGNYYCVPEIRDRLNLTERAARLVDLHKRYRPVEVRYERYGLMADISYIRQYQDNIGYRFDITEVAGSISKVDRIKTLVPLYETGKIYHPNIFYVTDTDGVAQNNVHSYIEQEYMAFPVPVHDDMLDALARITDEEGVLNDKKVKLALKFPRPEYEQELDYPALTVYG